MNILNFGLKGEILLNRIKKIGEEMKIAISGTHSVGKTTLFKELKKQEFDFFEDYYFIYEGARNSIERGYKIGTEHLQLDCYFRHLISERGENFITDRCIIDCLSYVRFYDIFDSNLVGLLEKNCFVDSRYDMIFYLPIEFEMEKDKLRIEDGRAKIDSIIGNYLYKYYCGKFHTVTGSIEDRINKVVDIIKEF